MDYKFLKDSNITDRIFKREFKNRDGFMFNDVVTIYFTVKCLHCGQTFSADEMRVAKTGSREYEVLCKNAPECDGNIEDMIPLSEFEY